MALKVTGFPLHCTMSSPQSTLQGVCAKTANGSERSVKSNRVFIDFILSVRLTLTTTIILISS